MQFFKLARHIVIRTEVDSIIHAYTSGEIVIEHVVPESWEDRFIATFNFPGVVS